jgi:hypothetical protein
MTLPGLHPADQTALEARRASKTSDLQRQIDELKRRAPGGGGGGGTADGPPHVIQDEGSALAQRSKLNFLGGVTATDDAANDRTNVSIDGSGISADSFIGISAGVAEAIEAAISAATNANTTRGKVTFTPNKVYVLNRPVLIAKNHVGLTLDHQGAVLQLSSAAPRAYDWNKVADYDTFQNVTFLNSVVNVNSVGGRHHCLIGPWQNGAWQRKINLENVHVDGLRVLNAPVGTDPAVDFRIGVHIGGAADITADSMCSFTNCSVKRVRSDGCLQLVAIHGAPVTGSTAKTWHDNILVEDISHLLPSVPTAFNNGAHVMAGTKGQGGNITIRRVRGTNSPDVGIEWDGWQDADLDDNLIEDSYDFAYFHVNYQLPPNPEAQLSSLNECVARRRNLNDHGQGFKVDVANGNRPGSIHFGPGTRYHRMPTSAGFAVQNEGVDILGPRRVTGDVRCIAELPGYSTAADVFPSAIRIRGIDTSTRTDVSNFRPRVRVTCAVTGSGANHMGWRSLLLRDGLLTNFDIDLESDVAITGAGNSPIIHADIGSTSGSCVLSGRISLVVPDNSGGGGGNTPVGLQFESAVFNSVPTRILVHDCDLAGLASTSTDINFAGATTLEDFVRFEQNRWRQVNNSLRPQTWAASEWRGGATGSDFRNEPGIPLQDVVYFGTGYLAISGRPQARRLKAVYRDPTTADSAQGDSAQVIFPDTGSAKTQTLPATANESDVLIQNNWTVTGQAVGHSFAVEAQDNGHATKSRPVYVAAKAARDAASVVDDWVGVYIEDPATGSAGTITLKTGIHSKPRIQTETGLIVGVAEASITSSMRSSTLYLVGTNASTFPSIKIVKKSGSTDDILQIADSGANPQIIINQAGQFAIKTSGASHSFGSAVGAMLAVGNITTAPSTNFTGAAGFFQYAQSGAVKFRTGNGNIVTLPDAPTSITGSRSGNAALASVLTALAGLGLIVDTTTA